VTDISTDVPSSRSPKPDRGIGGGPIGALRRRTRETVAEMRKVLWPSRKEMVTYTAVVIVFVVVMISLVAALDYGFAKVVLAVFG
jgi:preprotein translocase subunit SecE